MSFNKKTPFLVRRPRYSAICSRKNKNYTRYIPSFLMVMEMNKREKEQNFQTLNTKEWKKLCILLLLSFVIIVFFSVFEYLIPSRTQWPCLFSWVGKALADSRATRKTVKHAWTTLINADPRSSNSENLLSLRLGKINACQLSVSLIPFSDCKRFSFKKQVLRRLKLKEG